jgi:hypothetical protein
MKMNRWLVMAFIAFGVLFMFAISSLALAQSTGRGQKTFDSMCAACIAVRQGPGFMPAYSSTNIDDSELNDLVAYVQSLGLPPATATPTKPPETPRPTPTEPSLSTVTPPVIPTPSPTGTPIPPPTPTVTPSPTPTPSVIPGGDEGTTLSLDASGEASSGSSLILEARVEDAQGEPVSGVLVKFLAEFNFFGNSLVEIGEATTGERGVAVMEYVPRRAGDLRILGRADEMEAFKTISVSESGHPFYETEIGIKLPAPGPEVVANIGPTLEGSAPQTSFRLPGGTISWLLLLVGTVGIVWATYSLVLYQVLRIAGNSETRVVPLVGMALVATIGIILVLVIVTGPNSQIHAFP